MQYIILDLEWNTAFDKRRKEFVNEIIEFGAVKLDEHLEEVDTFSSFVKPVIEKKLTSRVRKLTPSRTKTSRTQKSTCPSRTTSRTGSGRTPTPSS